MQIESSLHRIITNSILATTVTDPVNCQNRKGMLASFKIALLVVMFAVASAFVSRSANHGRVQVTRQFADKIKITDGVEFDTIAREWRLKWSPDNDKKSLAAVQQSLNIFLPAIKKIDGVQSVQRIVCGGCLDYKVVKNPLQFSHSPLVIIIGYRNF